jgi:hypothetical protein
MKPLNVDPGRIVLFKERNKSNEKGPDLRGACNIDGIQYEVSIWERESKRGVPYLSGEVKLPRAAGARADDDGLRQPQDDDLDAAMAPVDESRRW